MTSTQDDRALVNAARLGKLFSGNTRSSGRFDPKNERMYTEYKPIAVEDWSLHLAGVLGVGAVPIYDDDTCQWAALDLDNHDSDEDLPIGEIAEKLAHLRLPLIPCRSKSGGIHCYLFLEKPLAAAKVRIFMTDWARAIGYGDCEIFPKQGKLTYPKDSTQKAFGNWINLPYFNEEHTARAAWRDGKWLTLDEFLDWAEKSKQSESDLRAFSKAEHPDAPPCIQKMFAHGVAQGHRNEALYNITVYYRKSSPNEFESKSTVANASVFSKPLPRAEMQRTIRSAGRPDCVYRCNEEPIKSLCDRETCVTRKFGITSGDLNRLDTVDALPVFTALVKYVTEPVRWEFQIDGVRIGNIKTETLLDWRAIRQLVADRLTRIVPLIKNSEWERILHPLMQQARIVEAPDDASVAGIVRDRLREFSAKADLASRGEDKEERKAVLRGLPVVQVVDGDRCVVFRGQDFVNYLKRTKSEEMKGVDLWFAVKSIGVTNKRMRIPGARAGEDNINVWCLPVKEVLRTLEHEAKAPEFRSEM